MRVPKCEINNVTAYYIVVSVYRWQQGKEWDSRGKSYTNVSRQFKQSLLDSMGTLKRVSLLLESMFNGCLTTHSWRKEAGLETTHPLRYAANTHALRGADRHPSVGLFEMEPAVFITAQISKGSGDNNNNDHRSDGLTKVDVTVEVSQMPTALVACLNQPTSNYS